MAHSHTWSATVPRLLKQGLELLRDAFRRTSLRALPLRDHLRGYGRRDLGADVKAAATVSLLDLPQGMAYAAVAGLPLQFGSMCSAVSGVFGAIFGSSRFTVLGPTNATAFMAFSYFAVHPELNRLALMPLLVFMVGALLALGAVARVAELAQYIMVEVLGKDNIFPASPSNPNLATRNALKRAQEILGTTEAEVKIFIDTAHARDRQTQAADHPAK